MQTSNQTGKQEARSAGVPLRERIPLVDLKAQYRSLKTLIEESLNDVMERTAFVHGPKVEEFEKSFAAYNRASRCVALNSGTDALFLTLKALGVKEGDEVITVSFTFFATAEAIVNAGAVAKFVDIDPVRYTLDPAKLEKAITPKTVGILPVHLYGMPVDMDPVLEIARKRGLWVVEDACQAHGATYKGKMCGTLGHAGAFSFYPSKNLGAYGDGGAIVTQDGALADKIRMLRDHGQASRYRSEIIGYNSRLDAMQAAILLVKLPFLDGWNEKRRTVASWYNEALNDIKQLSLPKSFADSKEVFHLYVVLAENRDELAAYLEANGISTAIHYGIPLHQQPPFAGTNHSLSETDRIAKRILSIPMYPELSREKVECVAEKIKAFFA